MNGLPVRALAALAVLVVSSCGTPITVGAVCEKAADCEPGQQCLTSVPAGFCTRGCLTEGSLTECPGGTICTFFGGSRQVCSTYCTVNADCRVNYECTPVRGSNDKQACAPEGLTR